MTPSLLHATCVALDDAEEPLAVLLRGVSGSGKSDLALRLIDQGAHLVADDQCELRRRDTGSGACLVARAPETIAGAMEVRGLGLHAVPNLPEARVALLVDLVAPDQVERLPEPATEDVMGVSLPRIALDPFEVSAPAKLRLALRSRGASIMEPSTAATPGRPEAAKSGRGPSTETRIMPREFQAPSDEARSPSRDGAAARRIALVTGLSGAGRTTALKVLEDMGYEAIDNLPLTLLDATIGEGDRNGALAVGIDIRTRNFAVQPFLEHIDRLRTRADFAVTLLFLDCDGEVLGRRFTETRRRHPLALDRPVSDGIAAERRLVAPLRARADLIVDTSSLTLADLGQVLSGHMGLDAAPGMAIFVTSFSYRSGLPREADLVFDTRFLVNPHYQEALRRLDGRDPRVAAYIETDPGFAEFFERLTAMLEPLLPRYEQDGKSYLTIALGCTGGRHRSVAVAEKLAAWLGISGHQVNITHRDLGHDPAADAQGA